MFRLPPVKLWRVLALVWAAASVAASGVVTVCSAGPVAIHWGSGGVPNGFAEPWMLWGLSLLSVLSMFTSGSWQKSSPGNRPLSREMASAAAAGLAALFSLAALTIAVYSLWQAGTVLVLGTIAILLSFPACRGASYRGKNADKKRKHSDNAPRARGEAAACI